MAARAEDDDPVGSATEFGSFLLLTDHEPWTREAGPDAARRYLSTEAADFCVDNAAGMRAFAIRSPRERRLATGGLPAFVGRIGGSTRLFDRMPSRADLTACASGETATGGRAHPDPLIGVCTNGRRDPCCALLGRPIALSLADRFGSRISEITHLGGHRFAGTMIVLPTGYQYGFLDSATAAAVVESALDGLVHPANLRGRAGLSPAAQAAEAWWRRKLGVAPPNAVVITGTDVVGAETRVKAVVDGSATAVWVRSMDAGRVTGTRCGSKPVAITRWSVR